MKVSALIIVVVGLLAVFAVAGMNKDRLVSLPKSRACPPKTKDYVEQQAGGDIVTYTNINQFTDYGPAACLPVIASYNPWMAEHAAKKGSPWRR